MNCARVQNRLPLYLAGELESREVALLSRHLDSCARCAAAAEELAETQELVEGALRTTLHAPAALHTRVMAGVRAEPARRFPWRALMSSWRGRQQLAAVAAALCLMAGGFLAGHWHRVEKPSPVQALPQPQRPTLSLALLGQDHREYLAKSQPAQVLGPDPRIVSRGMTQLLKFPVTVADLQPEGARLLGGRKCQLRGASIAFLLYDWKGERVSLYQMDGRKVVLPPLRGAVIREQCFLVGEAEGLGYVAWRSGAMNFVMVSGMVPERLLRLARRASGTSQSA
jgi:anti-sigma factor RsiW